jgi:hypothetical protein
MVRDGRGAQDDHGQVKTSAFLNEQGRLVSEP